MKKQISFFSALLMLIVLAGCVKHTEFLQPEDNAALLKSANLKQVYDMVPNEVLVKFKDRVDENNKTRVLGKFKGKHRDRILTDEMTRRGDNQGIEVVSMPGTVEDAITAMKGVPEVEYAEPNYIYTHQINSNDTYYTSGKLWGMYGDVSPLKTNTYGSHAAEAWANGHTGSATIYVGLIDEGYMYTHEDLAANAGKNPGEIAGNGIDDDGNGYKDDVYGWDFAGNNNSVFDGVSDDHGTHVAGTIGGVGGNGKGVAGVCWNVKILNAKFLGTNGGTLANAIKAVDYFTNLKTRANNPVNIVATNNSWGGGGFSQGLYDAIERAKAANILFIAAAGNDGKNTESTTSYPSGNTNDNIIAVASINSIGALSSWSNYAVTKVDLGAPGEAIYSSVPVSAKKTVSSGYASYSGTSMATPHVTGAVALYASTHPGATAAQIKAAILASVTPTASLSGKCVTGGRLNVSGF
jgi:subtilisin family serine protease